MRAKWNARRLAGARHVAGRSSRSAKLYQTVRYAIEFGGSSSGRTTVSDTVYLGSNPSPPATSRAHFGEPFSFGEPSPMSACAAVFRIAASKFVMFGSQAG